MLYRSTPLLLLVAWLVTAAAGCAAQRPFTWVDEISLDEEKTAEYRIGRRDLLGIRVWGQENMSARARVRADGRISLPFLRDVHVAGFTPNELSAMLQEALVQYVVEPIVIVTVEEQAALQVAILGEVGKPGTLSLPAGAGVLQAIAAAGGLTEYAARNGIYVVRAGESDVNPAGTRIRFRYEELATGGFRAASFRLRDGDVVVVE